MTLDSNPPQILSSKGSEPIDKSKDLSIASTQTPPANTDAPTSADRFEQARMAFFSK
jgi:hypothetical protein